MRTKEKKRGRVRKIMRMKKTETAMDRRREMARGRRQENKACIDNLM